ncbi:hypothetical protein AVEN_65322-1 [Araneus ventricosus]|uniref:Neurotransmitter-gated ion-channel ligand-binding domain-containing protein n=1 Tax=Araneus ventricosus TaxID=182803 RepID=A0A4Y2AG48_ARAVE|nr:hypothetical protein AVEN_65322-1 [Araneus ventricosus]
MQIPNDCDSCLENSTPPLKFEDIVPKNYDKLVPPTKEGEPTVVQIKISVLNINYVDEEKQAFGVDIFFHQVWNDPRLRIPPTHNTTRLVLNSKWRNNLWTPDTYFKKLVDGKVNDIIIPYSYMVVDSESTLFFASRILCNKALLKYGSRIGVTLVQRISKNTDSLKHGSRMAKIIEEGQNKNRKRMRR